MKKKQKIETLMGERYDAKRNITPAMAVKYYKENNIDITKESAKEVLDLMYLFAGIAVNQYIKEQKDGNNI